MPAGFAEGGYLQRDLAGSGGLVTEVGGQEDCGQSV